MNDVKYFYVRNPYDRRDVTVVTRVRPYGAIYKVEFAWAFRSNHDDFVKRLGRELVDARLDTKDSNFYSYIFVDEKRSGVIKFEILLELLKNPNTPKKFLEDISWAAYDYMPEKPVIDIFARDISEYILDYVER